MEKRINQKIEQHIGKFKDDIRNKILELNIDEKSKVNELIEYVYEYQRLSIVKEDFSKRKRVKNSIPVSNRCNARRANDEQCTRRRKDGCEYCGTHVKGTPNGFLDVNESVNSSSKKMDVVVKEINGIVYYADSYNNVYKPEDVMQGKENPQIIATVTPNNEINITTTISFETK